MGDTVSGITEGNQQVRVPRALGRAVRRERKRRGLTQPQLAEAAGVSRTSVSTLELGPKRYNLAGTMYSDVVFRILEALGCTCMGTREGCTLCVHVAEARPHRPEVFKPVDA